MGSGFGVEDPRRDVEVGDAVAGFVVADIVCDTGFATPPNS